MLKKIPISCVPIHLSEVIVSLCCWLDKRHDVEQEAGRELLRFSVHKYAFFLNSGLSAFFTVLDFIKKMRQANEVILPAYTASALVVAVQKAGLRPVLCDISLDDFNMDYLLLNDLVCERTLAIVGIHMFGIVAAGLAELKTKFPQAVIIEDCAQSLGSRIDGQVVGRLGDFSFFSFNKGKNLATYGGGCLLTDDDAFVKNTWRENGKGNDLLMFLKLLGLSLAVKPFVYGPFYSLISLFKEKRYSADVVVGRYSGLQSAVLLSLLKREKALSRRRYENGMSLLHSLKDLTGLILPKVQENTQPAFNRLPIVFKDKNKVGEALVKLDKMGIEASRLYLRPLHHTFDLGYKKEDFPNACYFAERLLTLPVHPLVTERDIKVMIGVIRDISKPALE